jgi:hypothetical protein
MRTLFLDVNYPIQSKLFDPPTRADVGESAVATSAKLDKPRRQFTLQTWDQLLRDQVENIRNEIHSGRITGVFWFDGGPWGDVTENIFIGEGNSFQKEFPMPFDNVFAPSWLIYVNGVLNTNWTMKEQAGILVFTSAPTGRITGNGKRKFRVVLEDQSESILDETQHHQSVFGIGSIILREVQATSVF